MAIPAFHLYAHKKECHAMFSPRLLEGVGAICGENQETVWCTMAPFAMSTAEMLLDTRVTFLNCVMRNTEQKKNMNMGKASRKIWINLFQVEALMGRIKTTSTTLEDIAEELIVSKQQFAEELRIDIAWLTDERLDTLSLQYQQFLLQNARSQELERPQEDEETAYAWRLAEFFVEPRYNYNFY
jgi:hypothetical protein